MKLEDVNEKLRKVGFLNPQEVTFLIRRKVRQSGDSTMGLVKASIQPSGDIVVNSLSIDPDIFEQVQLLFSGTGLEVEKLFWE